MLRADSHTKKELKAFTTAEILLSVAVFGVMVTGLAGGFMYGVQASATATVVARAQYIANEGLEATRNIRDANWTNLTDGTFGLGVSGNNWVFSGASDITGAQFTRTIAISTINTTTKQVVVTITWPQQYSSVNRLTETMQLTNWNRTVPVIGNWASPSIEGSADPSLVQNMTDIKYAGNYTYIVRNSILNNFLIYNNTSTSAPTQASTLTLSSVTTELAIAGNFAYIASTSDSQELIIVNISNPAAPTQVGTLNLSGNADPTNIFAIGTTVYMVRTQGGEKEFLIINATTPASPTITGSLDLGATPNAVFVSGNYAYIASANNSQELEVINITTPATPTLGATLNLSGNNDGLSITGFTNRIIIGRSGGELEIINTTTPTTPTTLGTFAAGGAVNSISLGNTNTYAFLATSNTTQEFKVINITNPASMTQVGFLNLGGNLLGIAYDSVKDRAYAVGVNAVPEYIILRPN